MYSIEARSLSKHFDGVKAVDDMSFTVDSGEIFGFLGPNGAGKSTMMMILTTLLKPTSGHALVSGYDVMSCPKQVRQKIGYVQQDTVVDEYLTGRENLILHARLSHIPKNQINSRIDDILGLIELEEKQNESVVTYSGGMRKRLDIAGGLLHRPEVLFLDEPTVGLDIQTRKKIWEYIKKIHDEFGMSLFLSTHYMEEADKLCDRVAIINNGTIQAMDSPQKMKSEMGSDVITMSIDESLVKYLTNLEKIPQVTNINHTANKLVIFASNGADAMPKILEIFSHAGIKINSITMTQPTLDDVFISYTGREISDDRNDSGKPNRPKAKRSIL